MSGDAGSGPVRRPRVIPRPVVPPGPLADLKALVYQLYLEAGAPSLDEIAARVAGNDDLAGAPERDTIHRIIRDSSLPPAQADVVAVVTVLATAARWDPHDAAGRARNLWVAARLDSAVGVPINQVTDPFALEVHRPISLAAADLPPLPRYVRRPHDERLARVVRRVLDGKSAMAVLVGGSSAGKTRACWEALEPLRAAGGWRLWHPYDPTRAHAALNGLDRVWPRTVVWLNETQEYLGASSDDGERVAAKLRSLLADPARAPVLVLGTLWPEHYAALPQPDGSQVRLVVEGTVVEVPEAFTGADLVALKAAAEQDPRLAFAAEHADDCQITQCLAGGPVLLDRLRTAPATAKALIWAAMDARLMGHRKALPIAFLEQAAEAYLTDTQWEQLREEWLEQALAYTSLPCKGAPGPVTRIRPKGSRQSLGSRISPAARGESGPAYRLADYLEQHARTHRADKIPPPGFWTAAAAHACPDDLPILGRAATARGLYRDAAQLHKNATAHGDPYAAGELVRLMHVLHPKDPRPAEWVVGRVAVDDGHGVDRLLGTLHRVRAYRQVVALAERAVTRVALDGGHGVESLLATLSNAGAYPQVVALAERAVTRVALDNQYAVESLLTTLHQVGAHPQVAALADRAATDVAVNDAPAVSVLLARLRKVGAINQAVAFAERAAADIPLDNHYAVESLLKTLHKIGQDEQVTTLAKRAVTRVPLNDQYAVESLLTTLHEVGAVEQVTALADRAATSVALNDAPAVSVLLARLRKVGAINQAVALAERAAAGLPLDNPAAVDVLVARLRDVGALEQAVVLAERLVPHVLPDSPFTVAVLLGELHEVGAIEQVTALADRAATDVAVNDAPAVGVLLARLRKVGAIDQAVALAERAVAIVPLDDLSAVAVLVGELHEVGAVEQVTALAKRAVAHVTLEDTSAVAVLLGELHKAGAVEQVTALATRAAPQVPLDNRYAVDWLLYRLHKVGAIEQAVLLAERAGSHVPLDNPSAIAALLNELHKVGSVEQAAALAERAIAYVPLEDMSAVAILLGELHKVGAVEQVTALADRAVAHVPLDTASVGALLTRLHKIGATEQLAVLADRVSIDAAVNNAFVVGDLLDRLHKIGAIEQVAALADRAATDIPLDSTDSVTSLLGKLHKVGAIEHATAVARRAVSHVPVNDATTVDALLNELHKIGANDEIRHLIERLPAVGRFDTFLRVGNHGGRFRFGREADATAATRWAWDDLE